MPKHIYNLKKDPVDTRDKLFTVKPAINMPKSADLRPQFSTIYNQGDLGSCTANAIAAVLDFIHVQDHGLPFVFPSRLFIYYFERLMEGSVDQDAGACIRDGIQVVVKEGACPETVWPYDTSKFTVKPGDDAVTAALKYQALEYVRIPFNSLLGIKQTLVDGHPLVCGIQVYDSFESDDVAKTGMVPMPNVFTEQLCGGHAVSIVGFDDAAGHFIMRNSWGEDWGDNGYFYLPYAFIANPSLTSDIWTIKKAE